MRLLTARYPTALIAILLVGAALRTIQYGTSASMSYDELAIALNVTDRGLKELLSQPLMHNQVAPLGFLLVEKVAVTILGNNEAAFRFFPYLFSLLSLILFWRVSTRYLRTPSMLAALIVFAMSPTLVLYGGTVKQYSGDVAVSLFLLFLTLRYFEEPYTLVKATAVGITGGLAVLLSQPAVLVAAGLGALILVEGQRAGKPYRQLFVICAGWCVGAVIQAYTSLTNLSVPTSEVMRGFWRGGFVPRPWAGWAEFFWIPARLADFFAFLVAYIITPNSLSVLAFAGIYVVLLLLGILYLPKRELRTAAILFVPVVMAIAAACVRLLPLTDRVSLFIGPSLLIGCFAGFDRIRSWMPSRLGHLTYAAAFGFAILPAGALLLQSPPPRKQSESRRVLEEVRAHRLPEDKLVVIGWWGRMSTEYYGRRLGLEDWTHVPPLEGTMEQILRGYFHGIDAFRGEPRAWFFLEQTWYCEDKAVLGYLSVIGKRLQLVQAQTSNSSSAQLYDLSDPKLLAQANAESFPIATECRR